MSVNSRKQKGNRRAEDRRRRGQSTHRTHEIAGILVLACALLTGPSLISLHFGKKQMMGPFGAWIGNALHASMGLAAYVVVIALIALALRIFAAALGRNAEPVSPATLWRERFGTLFAVICFAVLLHLGARPNSIHGSSFGGAVGELSGELLCGFLSPAGAWIVAIAGFATGLILATNLSWTRLAVYVWQLAKMLGVGGNEVGARLQERFADFSSWFVAHFRRASLTTDGSGTAALPPIVEFRETTGNRRKTPRPRKNSAAEAVPMPVDLEIGRTTPAFARPIISADEKAAEPSEPTVQENEATAPPMIAIERPAIESSPVAPPLIAETPEKSAAATVPTIALEETPASVPASADTLTIVQSKFAQQQTASDNTEKSVDSARGPGYELFDDTYRLPPISLLETHEGGESNVDREAIYQQADRLTKALADYSIEGRVTKVHPGPVVTMYEFVPAPGTRVSKVASLCDDLAMSLHAQRVRIVAPIPGKGAIGIEVPNDRREVVSLKEIIADDSFQNSKTKLGLALGKNIVGAPVVVDLAKMPHLLVAGATGAGKSVSINSMICSLLYRCTPEEVQMIMIDPKFLELSDYNDIPHLLMPVVTDPKRANIALRWAVAEMERRYQMLAEAHVRDINTYNRKVDKLRNKPQNGQEASDVKPLSNGSMQEAAPSQILVVRKEADGTEVSMDGSAADGEEDSSLEITTDLEGGETENSGASAEMELFPDATADTTETTPADLRRLPYIVVLIDEFADLMMVASKEVETSIARLAQKARAAGIHLIVATQRPSVDVITGLIKANFPSRIAFQVASNHDSKTILGTQGAENLLGSGDMLVLDRGVEMKRIHGAFISDTEIQEITAWVKKQGRPVYDENLLKHQEEEESEQNAAEDDDHDEMYDQAVALVSESRQASISMIQRRLRIGYNRAARMVEKMEREGIVGPADGVRGREVLVSPH